MASRALVASFLADKLKADRRAAIKAAAHWMLETGRARQAGYLARDVAAILADRGYVMVRIVSARPLEGSALRAIEKFVRDATNGIHLEVVTEIDRALVGGFRVELPGAVMDASVSTKLAKLVEGAAKNG
jgi:F0F1-type ATP synthase delta subunit